jgi:hypothetical protein
MPSTFGLTNPAYPVFGGPYRSQTCKVVGAATGLRLVKGVTGGEFQVPAVATCGAGEKAYGLLDGDAADGDLRRVVFDGDWEITAGAAVTAGQVVQSDAQGRVVPHTTGVAVGVAGAAAATGEPVHVKTSF